MSLPVLLLSFERVQQWLVVKLAEHYFDARIDVDTIDVLGDATIARIEVRGVDAGEQEAPFLALDQALADYQIFPGNGRNIRALHAERAEVNVLSSADGRTNYEFLTRNKDDKPAETSARFIPEDVTVDSFALRAQLPRWGASLSGVQVEADLKSGQDMQLNISGQQAAVEWQLGGDESQQHSAAGGLEVIVARSGASMEAEGSLEFPAVATLQAKVSHAVTAEQTHVVAAIEEATLERSFLASLLADASGVPLDFARLRLQPSSIVATQVGTDWQVEEAHVDAQVTHLVLGSPQDASSSLAQLPEHAGLQSGTVLLDARDAGEEFAATMKADVKGIAEVDGELTLTKEGEAQRVHAIVMRAELDAAGVMDVVRAYANVPVSFHQLAVYDTTLEALRGAEFRLLNAKFNLAATEVAVPLGETLWELGEVRAEGTGGEESGALVDAQVHLNGAGPHHVRLEGDFENLTYTAEVASLPRSALLRALPPAARRPVELLPALSALAGQVHGTWAKPVYTVQGELRPALEGPEDAAVTVNLEGDTAARTLEGTVHSTLGEQAVAANIKTAAGGWSAAVEMAKAQPKDWVKLFSETAALDSLSTLLTGTAKVNGAAGGAVDVTVDADAAGLRYGDLRVPEGDVVKVAGALKVAAADTKVSGKKLTFVKDEQLNIALGDYSYDWKAKKARAKLDAAADLTYAGPILNKPDLSGDVTLKGPLQLSSDDLVLDFTANSEHIGYGEWSTPYNVPAEATGKLHYAISSKQWNITPFEARVGEANSLTMDSLVSAGDTISAGKASLKTDLTPLVSKGYLAEVLGGGGTVEAANIRIADGKMQGEFAPDLHAEKLALPKRLAQFENVRLAGNFAYTETLSGSGRLATDALETGGVHMSGFQSNVAAESNRFRLDNIVTTLFGGEAKAILTVAPLDEGIPIRLEAQVTDGDLAEFTREFKPPRVSLTGIFSGDVMLEYAASEIKDFKAVLKSENGFSLNKDLLEQVVKAELTKGLGVGVIESVIGEAEQRPFDSATMDLGFVDGRIVGVAVLESKQFDLTIDVLVDPETIFAAMALRQEQGPQE